jgi:hypothetical protein
MGTAPSKEIKELFDAISPGGAETGTGPVAPAADGHANINEKHYEVTISTIRALVDEVVAERLENKKTIYSFLQMSVSLRNSADDYAAILEEVMVRALRKKDIYYVAGSHSVVAMIHDAPTQFYDIIKKRVNDLFLSLCPDKDVSFDISINPASYIL